MTGFVKRFLRFARLPRLLNALRFFRLAALLNRFASTVKAIFNSKGLRFIVYATVAIVLFFGFLFYWVFFPMFKKR